MQDAHKQMPSAKAAFFYHEAVSLPPLPASPWGSLMPFFLSVRSVYPDGRSDFDQTYYELF